LQEALCCCDIILIAATNKLDAVNSLLWIMRNLEAKIGLYHSVASGWQENADYLDKDWSSPSGYSYSSRQHFHRVTLDWILALTLTGLILSCLIVAVFWY
jgi:hypothetical protein